MKWVTTNPFAGRGNTASRAGASSDVSMSLMRGQARRSTRSSRQGPPWSMPWSGDLTRDLTRVSPGASSTAAMEPPVMQSDDAPQRVGTLLSVNVGMPKDVPWQGRTVFTGVFKSPLAGACRVGRLNLDGDGQGDLAGHGGEQRAVFVYQLDSYRHWERELGRSDFVPGQFGENFTVEGLGDDEVCIGDHYQIGSARFEVTQPRVTCYRVGLRMNDPRIPALLVSHR